MSALPSLPSLPTSHNQTRSFGLDLGSLWRDLRTAWRGMTEWPVFSWLWPQQAVRVCLPTGGQALSRHLNTPLIEDSKRAENARFESILVPENLLLRRTLNLPRLPSAELEAALMLEIQTLSPFSSDDITWTHEIIPFEGDSLRVDVVLTSRKLIAQYIGSVSRELKSQNPEIWVARVHGPGFMPLPGYGETRRQRQGLLLRWASALLAMLALALIGAMLVTPSVQLYLRYLQANQSMLALQQKASPVLAQREALVRTTDQLTQLAALTGNPVPALQTLKLITEALSDDSSLLSLQIQGLKVSLSGQTSNAAALMKQLGSTPGLRDVKAPAPATKPLGAPRESFTIEFTLDPAQLKIAP